MADTKISALPAAAAALATMEFPVNDTNVTEKVTVTQLLAFVTANLTGFIPSARTITAGVGLSGGGDLSANRTIDLENTAVTPASYGSATKVSAITVDQQGRLTAASEITVTPAFASITATPTTLTGYGITDAVPTSRTLTASTGLIGGGDLTTDRSVALASIADQRLLGNISGGAAAPIALTPAQVTAALDVMTGGGGTGLKGLVPAQVAGDVTKFLRGDATWQTVAASPGGSTTQVQYNNAGAFAGATRFTWNEGQAVLVFGDLTDGPAGIKTPTGVASGGDGLDFNISTGDGAPTGANAAAGNFSVNCGNGGDEGGLGGSITLNAGIGTVSKAGGPITLQAGSANGTTAGAGGGINLLSGNATEGNGGSIVITATDAATLAADDLNGGSITLTRGLKTGAGVDGQIILANIPSSNPGIPGALYQSAGVVMVSL